MEGNSNILFDATQYDAIDIGNLFSQWHPDVRKFTENLNRECTLDLLKETKITTFVTSNFKEVLNLTNTEQCQDILDRILKENNPYNFFNLLRERDTLYPRTVNRGYSVEQIFELVEQDNYHPLLFLELNKKVYIIDGRTRFYCCLFLNVPARVRILSDNELNRKCNIKAHL